ncbi:hypothetical protein CJF24_22815 [Aeromonas veronii]|uniref:Uncharacterized protein n=1 Tax=Aeromonas veronii TaxID=654 RepID=A0ABY3MF45_AERVE|nr:hypothetical protein CGZ72_08695 [Aeromonas veronii]RDU87154.1 hypothetical protein CGZ76_09530 [Aeromonas veronii]TEY53351.1 hypothetical protein CIG14_07460 [Aeromonas veronii]TEY80369.1 hypothetical protein CIG16_08400 [Aeromonas veronii]TYD39686.1 hypothetical protein CJF24_22815 [Aeromonas veronii]
MWLNHKTDLQTYFTVNVGLHFVQHQPTLFSPTYEIGLNLDKELLDRQFSHSYSFFEQFMTLVCYF